MKLKFFKQVRSIQDLNDLICQYNDEKRKVKISGHFGDDDDESGNIFHRVYFIVEELSDDIFLSDFETVEEIILFEYIEEENTLNSKMKQELENEGNLLALVFKLDFFTVNTLIDGKILDTFF